MGGSAVWTQVMGLMGFCLVLSHLFKHYSARLRVSRATAALKPLGEELELEYIPSQYAKGQGVLRGVYANRKVEIDPDDTRSIRVHFHGSPDIVLLTQPPDRPLPNGLVELRARDSAFASFWRVRQASADQASRLGECVHEEWVEAFRGAWARNIESVSVYPDGVTVVFDFGHPPCIPVRAIRELLPACVAFAERLEPSAMASKPKRQLPPVAGQRSPNAELSPIGFSPALLIVAGLALICRLALAWATTQANPSNLDRLAIWARYVGGDVYLADAGFELPPALVPLLEILARLAGNTGIGVSFWSAALSSCVELGGLLLLWCILGGCQAGRRTHGALLLAACWPAALALAGAPASLASALVGCALLSVYWTAHQAHVLAGAAMGLGLCFTPASLYAMPTLLLMQQERHGKVLFSLGATLAVALGWLPWWPLDAAQLIARVFHATDAHGQYGLAWLASHLLDPKSAMQTALETSGSYLALGGAALALALRENRRAIRGAGERAHGLLPQETARLLLARLGVVAGVVLLAAPSTQLSDLVAVGPLLALVAPALSLLFMSSTTALTLVESTTGLGNNYSTLLHLLSYATLASLTLAVWVRKERPVASEARATGDFAPRWLNDWRVWAGSAALTLLLSAVLLTSAASTAARSVPESQRAAQEARTYLELSSWLLRRGRNAPGIETAREATRLQPNNAAAWNNVAVGYSNRQEWDAAITAATRAVELAPTFQLARNNLAWAVRHKQEASRASGRSKQRPPG